MKGEKGVDLNRACHVILSNGHPKITPKKRAPHLLLKKMKQNLMPSFATGCPHRPALKGRENKNPPSHWASQSGNLFRWPFFFRRPNWGANTRKSEARCFSLGALYQLIHRASLNPHCWGGGRKGYLSPFQLGRQLVILASDSLAHCPLTSNLQKALDRHPESSQGGGFFQSHGFPAQASRC